MRFEYLSRYIISGPRKMLFCGVNFAGVLLFRFARDIVYYALNG